MLLALLLAAVSGALSDGALLPPVAGRSLSGQPVQLPDAARGRPALLIFGFSRPGGGDARLWSERFQRDPAARQAAVCFNVMVLESVPRLLRGMVSGSIRSGMPAALRDRSILVYQGEAEWRRRLNVSSDQYACVAVLDAGGRVRAMGHGPFSEAAYAAIGAAITRLLPQTR